MALGGAAKRFVTNAPREFVLLLERAIAAEVRGPYIKVLLARLRAAKSLAIAGGKALVRLAERFLARAGELLTLARIMEGRFGSLTHLFGPGLQTARANAARRRYFNLVDEIRELLRDSGAAAMLKESNLRDIAQTLRKQMMQNVGFGVFDNYRDLKRETALLNRMRTMLDPAGEFAGSLRFSAHHVIEDRMYQTFAKEWKSIGWKSEEDMMATAISYEAHTYSPKGGKLPGLAEDEEALEAFSPRLVKAIGEPGKYKSASEAIDAYIDFYRIPANSDLAGTAGAAQTRRIVDALKTVKQALKDAARK